MGGWADATPSVEVRLESALDAYDRLFHRVTIRHPELTGNLPTPHELRAGETRNDVMDQLRRGRHLDEQATT